MQQPFKAVAGVALAALAAGFILLFVMGGTLLPDLGRRMDMDAENYGGYGDVAEAKAVSSHTPPRIVRRNLKAWGTGETIFLANLFQGLDEAGRRTDILVSDIRDEEGNSVMYLFHAAGKYVAFPEKGAYQIDLRTLDGERRETKGTYVLIVDDR